VKSFERRERGKEREIVKRGAKDVGIERLGGGKMRKMS
jgi:hypothetical protein